MENNEYINDKLSERELEVLQELIKVAVDKKAFKSLGYIFYEIYIKKN